MHSKRDIEQLKRQKQRNEKAKMLREYAKICKRESIQSDRVNLGPKRSTGAAEKHNMIESVESPTFFVPQTKRARVEASNDDKDGKEELQPSMAANIVKRTDKRRKQMQRTNKKGQPVIKNQILQILSKLKPGSGNS